MLTKNTKLLAVRLPEADKRRFKSLAASRGISLQEAVHQALEVWAAQLQPEDPLTGVDSETPRRRGDATKRT